MLGRIPRRAVAATLAAAAMLIPASPALAHFCYKDFKSQAAAEKAAATGPWMTAEEFFAELQAFAEAEGLPQCVIDDAEAWFEGAPPNRAFMGPGFLAGGTAGTDKTPSHFGYTPFDSFGASCPPPQEEA